MSIPANIQQHIFDLLSKTSNVSFVRGEAADTGSLGLTAGQQVVAEVVGLLPYGRAQVSIGTARLNLELPMAVRVGQNLEMTYVASEPRPTFAMARPGETSPPVRLSDASRLLGLLLGNQQMMGDPQVRASLQSVSQLLHQTEDSDLIATVMDEALTYTRKSSSTSPSGTPLTQLPEQAGRNSFEAHAGQILQQLARNSRFTMLEAVNQPATPLPLIPGEEVNAAVTGTLPGGRVFVQIAGTALELVIPGALPKDGIIRLTYLASLPKPLFALPRTIQENVPGSLSEAGRWLSVLEHSQGGVSSQQMNVLERLNTVISSLPPDSPAYSAIRDEALTYDAMLRRPSPEASAAAASLQSGPLAGNGIVLHDDMAKLLQALIKGNRLALLEAINQQALPTGLMPGQQMRGDVLAALGGGRFMLEVAGRGMEFMLPKGVTTGDRLQLFFITGTPRPTFLLARFGETGDSTVSQTGRWLGTLQELPRQQNSTSGMAGILRTILGEPPTDAARTSQMLAQSLKQSGLFYESHLGRWFGDSYPLEELLKEPQGKLSTLKPLLVPGAAQALLDNNQQINALQEHSAALLSAGTRSHAAETAVDPRALPLVQDQLATLQSNQLLFRGNLCPGQPMEWRIQEREQHRNRSGAEERSWDTTLSLDLPRLGEINARLTLDGGRIKLQVIAADEKAVATLEQGKGKLVDQLEGAGLVAEEIRIQHEA